MKYLSVLLLIGAFVVGCSPDDGGSEGFDASDDTQTMDTEGEDAGADIGETDSSTDAIDGDTDDVLDSQSAEHWSPIAPLAAGPRQETAVVAVDGKVYVIGGYTDTASLVATVEAYDPANDTWSDVADVPDRLHHANAAVAGGKIYVLGYLVEGFAASGRCFEYDPDTDTWTELDPMPSGTERGSSAIATIGDEIYVAGGLRSGAVPDFSKFDPVSGEWTSLPDAPRSFDHAGYGAIDGKLYVAGGRDSQITAFTGDVDIFDPDSGEWSSGASMPTPRGGVASAVADGQLYVFGGEGTADVASGVFDDAEAYDPVADAWRVLDPMPNPRHGMGAATVDGSIIVPGGADEQAFAAVDTSSTYEP